MLSFIEAIIYPDVIRNSYLYMESKIKNKTSDCNKKENRLKDRTKLVVTSAGRRWEEQCRGRG